MNQPRIYIKTYPPIFTVEENPLEEKPIEGSQRIVNGCLIQKVCFPAYSEDLRQTGSYKEAVWEVSFGPRSRYFKTLSEANSFALLVKTPEDNHG